VPQTVPVSGEMQVAKTRGSEKELIVSRHASR
jgi:hypothetical protein